MIWRTLAAITLIGACSELWPSGPDAGSPLARLAELSGKVTLTRRGAAASAEPGPLFGGDLIETGVWRGGTTIFMRALLKAHWITNRCVWAADSFEGLPPPNPEPSLYTAGTLAKTAA